MLNKIILKGSVGRAPQVSVDQNGREVATFSLATHTTWKDSSGEWQRHVDWHRITVFRAPTISWIKDILQRGDTVYVEGRLSYYRWTDSYRQVRVSPTIVIGYNGKIEHLRSKDPNARDFPEGDLPEEIANFTNNPPQFLLEMSSTRSSSSDSSSISGSGSGTSPTPL